MVTVAENKEIKTGSGPEECGSIGKWQVESGEGRVESGNGHGYARWTHIRVEIHLEKFSQVFRALFSGAAQGKLNFQQALKGLKRRAGLRFAIALPFYASKLFSQTYSIHWPRGWPRRWAGQSALFAAAILYLSKTT